MAFTKSVAEMKCIVLPDFFIFKMWWVLYDVIHCAFFQYSRPSCTRSLNMLPGFLTVTFGESPSAFCGWRLVCLPTIRTVNFSSKHTMTYTVFRNKASAVVAVIYGSLLLLVSFGSACYRAQKMCTARGTTLLLHPWNWTSVVFTKLPMAVHPAITRHGSCRSASLPAHRSFSSPIGAVILLQRFHAGTPL